jgi:hypothetical protein
MRSQRQPEPSRRWVASVLFRNDPEDLRTLTTTVHGPNPTEAERRYLAEHPDVAAVVLRQEMH